jgi:hypothetical protein
MIKLTKKEPLLLFFSFVITLYVVLKPIILNDYYVTFEPWFLLHQIPFMLSHGLALVLYSVGLTPIAAIILFIGMWLTSFLLLFWFRAIFLLCKPQKAVKHRSVKIILNLAVLIALFFLSAALTGGAVTMDRKPARYIFTGQCTLLPDYVPVGYVLDRSCQQALGFPQIPKFIPNI